MGINRGKKFESIIKDEFLKVKDTFIHRLHDQTTGFVGSTNICDFIIYKYPHQLLIECKAITGSTLNFKSHITNSQWIGMTDALKINGMIAGIVVWFIDYDNTLFLDMEFLNKLKNKNFKSFNINMLKDDKFKDEIYVINSNKKRVFFEYDIEKLLNEVFLYE